MNYYETLLIIHPALEAGRLKDIILSIEENLKKEKASMLSIDLWGKKRLAYLIEKQKFGTYVKLQFSGQGDCVKKIEMSLEHNSNVLSYLTTIIAKSDISDQTINLDDQIAGQSRETLTPEENKSSEKQMKSDESENTEEKSDLEVEKTNENEKQMESDESENTEEKSDLEVEKTSENEKISEESVEE